MPRRRLETPQNGRTRGHPSSPRAADRTLFELSPKGPESPRLEGQCPRSEEHELQLVPQHAPCEGRVDAANERVGALPLVPQRYSEGVAPAVNPSVQDRAT